MWKMSPMKEKKLACYFAGVLLVVGAIAYAAFPVQTPEEPVRIMFKSISGNVLFDHKTHGSDIGYGIACKECHHHPQEEEMDLRPCRDCHQIPETGESVPEACFDCHDAEEVEDSEIMKNRDAVHAQCWQCHDDFGSGPGSGTEQCSSCHVL